MSTETDTINQAGTVEVLQLRIYPLDAMTGDHTLSTEVVVEPGTFPLYRDGDAYFWMLTGRINTRSRKIGDGMFIMGGSDGGDGPEVTFPSRRYGPVQLAELMDEPTCTEGDPAQRLRFDLTPEVSR
jgi:hypothetical protein